MRRPWGYRERTWRLVQTSSWNLTPATLVPVCNCGGVFPYSPFMRRRLVMRNFRLLAALILGFAISLVIYRVQNAFAHADSSQPNFLKLFPRPTGQNGYEEFVMATDLTESSRVWQEYEKGYSDSPDPTLAIKRRVLADPDVQRALALIRTG